jgi:hypothetical protein
MRLDPQSYTDAHAIEEFEQFADSLARSMNLSDDDKLLAKYVGSVMSKYATDRAGYIVKDPVRTAKIVEYALAMALKQYEIEAKNNKQL